MERRRRMRETGGRTCSRRPRGCGAVSSTSACPDTTTRGERRHNHIESPRDRSLAGVRTFRATPESDSGGTKCKEKNAGAGDVPGARVSPCLLYLVELSRSTLAFEVFARNPGCCLAGGSEARRQCHAADESLRVGSRSTRIEPRHLTAKEWLHPVAAEVISKAERQRGGPSRRGGDGRVRPDSGLMTKR